jgi:hypothetical protein
MPNTAIIVPGEVCPGVESSGGRVRTPALCHARKVPKVSNRCPKAVTP